MDGNWRRAAVRAAAACGLVVAVLGAVVHVHPGPLDVDRAAARVVAATVLGHHLVPFWDAWRFQHLFRPDLLALAVGILVALAVLARDPLAALVAAIAPPLAVYTVDAWAKPLIGRAPVRALSFPSGTTTGVAALVAVLLLLAYRWWGRRGVVLLAPFGAAAILIMSASVVRTKSHLATDAVGGVAYGGGVVLIVAVAIAEGAHRLRARARRSAVAGPDADPFVGSRPG